MTAEPSSSGENDAVVDDGNPSLYFILFSFLLLVIILLSKKLHDNPRWNSIVSEAALVLILGSLAGAVIHLLLVPGSSTTTTTTNQDEISDDNNNDSGSNNSAATALASLLSFDPHIFFYALLPPILFYAGYELRRELFYRHIQPIVMFACIGTAVSALTTGGLLCLARPWFSTTTVDDGGDDNDNNGEDSMFSFAPTIMELFTFGALISATDAVSVLAILQKKRVDPHLFSLVFGESALNDAVALVLFHVFAHCVVVAGGGGTTTTQDQAGDNAVNADSDSGATAIVRSILVQRVAMFALQFLLTALLSPILGVGLGVMVALIFKHCDLRQHPKLELTIYIFLMYIPFLIAEECHLSGIVAIFFTGMSASRYVSPNVSTTTQHNADAVFHLAAYVAETAIFLELGLSLFGLNAGTFHWIFIGCAFTASLLGRALSVYPLAYLYNVSLRELPGNSSSSNTAAMDNNNVVDDNNNKIDDKQQELLADDDKAAAASTSCPSSKADSSSQQPTSRQRKTRGRARTPAKRKDQKISVNMSHLVWFAGLRGAVAYACAREFPVVNGHQNEMMTATMVIVLFTIIGMGGTTEWLLQVLDIAVDVDEDLYMENWHKLRELKGPFHAFGTCFVFVFFESVVLFLGGVLVFLNLSQIPTRTTIHI
jgi:NhaP-type Na+/H+ or K+/H+ antiporter